MRTRIFFSLLVILFAQGASEAASGRPNILFLFTDDQRLDTIHALGNTLIQTPNLDRLVRSGFVMTSAYCMGSNIGAVCLPSRTMLLSGKSLFHLKPQNADGPTLPRSLNESGYITYHHGKTGNTPRDIQQLFQRTHYISNDQGERRSGFPGKEVANDAIAFLRDRPRDKPFFMYLAFANPHDPRVVNAQYRSRYDEQRVPLPKNYLALHPFDNGEMTVRDETLASWPRTTAEIRRHLTDYYGVITYLDMQIGRILAALQDSGEYHNTIIIFSSDHGLAMGSHGLMGKQNLYEHSMKAPLIFAGPGIRRGRSDALVYLFDLYPTVCELLGIRAPQGIDGRSFARVMTGKNDKARDAILLAYKSVQRAVRQGEWKLIRYPLINYTQLFNLKRDPGELHNLAESPSQQEKVLAMMRLLEQQQKLYDDTALLTSNTPARKEITAAELTERLRKQELERANQRSNQPNEKSTPP